MNIHIKNWLLSSCLLLAAALRVEAETPPNVVVIISDDQHWADYGFMGHPHLNTPHLDKLASESLLFPRGYVPSSLCCPSLATIISGLYPHQSLITSNDPPLVEGKKRKGLDDPAFLAGRDKFNQHMDSLATLPRLLKQKDYLSFQTGKWWQGKYTHGGFTHGMTQGSRHGDEGLKIGREGLQPIKDFIGLAKDQSKPFFVWYAPFMPHTPHTPPERLLIKYKDKAPTLEVAKYWAMIEWLDETCGEMMQMLEDQKMAENTIVIYVCDNGWIQDPNNTNKYAPRSKQSQFDGGLRTPIMVRWPGKVKPAKSDALAISIDIAPTILKAVGLPVTEQMQGLNLLDADAVNARKTIFGEIFTHDSQDLDNAAASLRWRWIIDGHNKLIVPYPKNEPASEMELYDLSADENEKTNLAAQKPDKVEALKKVLDAWWRP